MATTISSAEDVHISQRVALAVRRGLASTPKTLPPWLFYDEAGSRHFDQITELPEYYLTRTERAIFAESAGPIVARAAAGIRLRIAELGAGSADKTRLLLAAAVRRQGALVYEPLDVSETALDAAVERIESELPQVAVAPLVADYTVRLDLHPLRAGERRLVLYIGSSIGNFEPDQAAQILRTVRAALAPGDALLLGVDLVKDEQVLLAAYDDAAGVTAAFNRNILTRLNRELDADFDPAAFAHRAVWNPAASRIEMHLESRHAQTVQLPALDLSIQFQPGERIHTENSYKYQTGQVEALLESAGFTLETTWTDRRNWFAVNLARVN
ncbi:MAG TPA: L-histidine N(alpha)-methyltransferase [Terracidiphilus sp.]|jgi:dimethylhistidine N-methyltransferase|nr:L-histidine N(alpha)-methyltransferase [Terracidiphilus sp.]